MKTELEKLGYRLEERGPDDTVQRPNATDKLVIWWKKGYKTFGFHWKCDGPGPKYWIEVTGPSLPKCLQNFLDEVKTQQL
jgi:hypothetical protein